MIKKPATPIRYVQPYRYPSPNIPISAIRRLARRIAEKFQPEKIILFGSYAYGTPHEESDVDLLVIMPCRNAIDQSIRICAAFERQFSLDLIVCTPYQIKQGLKDPDDRDWFLYEITKKGIVLYEAPNSAVGAKSGGRSGRGKVARRLRTPTKRSRVLPLPASGGEIPQGARSGTRPRRATNP